MNCRAIADRKIAARIIIMNQFIGILISGSLLFRVYAFALLDIKRMSIPVSPPDTTPPIPRIPAKFRSWNSVIRM